MRFRKYLFTTLAVVSLLLNLYFINNILQARSRAEAATSEQVSPSTGTSMAYNCIMTPSLMALFGFSALAYHYHKGLKKQEVKDANPEGTLDPHLE